jgi:hypothetical protein
MKINEAPGWAAAKAALDARKAELKNSGKNSPASKALEKEVFDKLRIAAQQAGLSVPF